MLVRARQLASETSTNSLESYLFMVRKHMNLLLALPLQQSNNLQRTKILFGINMRPLSLRLPPYADSSPSMKKEQGGHILDK